MKVRSIILTIFLAICFSANAQVDDFQKKIIDFLQINGTKKVYKQEFDNTLHLLNKQFKTANAPESYWEELRSDRDQKVDDLIQDLAFAYRKHFSLKDIGELNDFYNTETAQLWQEFPDQLTEEQQLEVDSFLESDAGKRMIYKEKALKVDMDEIASHWKRELFAEKMSMLIRNGYIPQQ